jgi:hypothetical protein
MSLLAAEAAADEATELRGGGMGGTAD